HDVSHVTGAVNGFAPTGGVTFVLYNLPNCGGIGQIWPTDGSENGDVRSQDTLALVPGTYGFIATVADDNNYVGKSGDCEPFTVAQATTTTVTAIHDANHDVVTEVALGTIVHDSATVTSQNSAQTPGGNVNFTFFPNGSCTKDTGSSAGSHALNNAGVAD